jgi:hypothetical protein
VCLAGPVIRKNSLRPTKLADNRGCLGPSDVWAFGHHSPARCLNGTSANVR